MRSERKNPINTRLTFGSFKNKKRLEKESKTLQSKINVILVSETVNKAQI